MGKVSLRLGLIGLMVCFGPAAAGPSACVAQSITSSLKQSVSKFSQAVTPKTRHQPVDDAVSLSGKGKPGATLYTAVGRLYEESGKLTEAAQQYEKALKHTPDYLGALLAYAQLKDRRTGDSESARKLYLRAAKAHPNEASVFNNLGAFYARGRKFDLAVTALRRAIHLQPKTKKYRNNIAVVLVETGQTNEALTHLKVVHSEAVAHYNLGYLLEKKGQSQAAAAYFSIALRKNPSLVQARMMLQRVQARSIQARRLAGQSSASPRISRRPHRPAGQIRRPAMRQLPPPKIADSATRPGERRVTDSPSRAAAPMPPDWLAPRRLPPVSRQPVTGPALAIPQPPLAP